MERITFVWDIHYKCNFRCPFCWFYGKWEEMGKHNVYPGINKLSEVWDRMYDLYGECQISITGGEPSIYPDFVRLIENLSKKHIVKITSQLSCAVDDICEKINPERVFFDINFHPLEAKSGELIEKIRKLKNKGFRGGVCYLAYPPQMKDILKYRDEFERNGITFALAAFWGEYEGKKYPESYTEREREAIKPFLGDMNRVSHHLEGKKTKGRLCRAGCHYASIKADGTVTRCGPLSHKPIGNIFDKDFRLMEAPSPCEADVCPNDEYVWLVDGKEG
ncbi:MAG: radical SAM protein [Endomicrobiales bacterium]|nr:radical SAM protein [Endomicrobiales bacterium]